MSKGIILLLIYAAWKIYGFYKKSVAENEQKVKGREKSIPGKEKKKSIFDELLEQVEQNMGNPPSKTKRREPVKQNVSSEKADWEFGLDELKTSKKAHERHKKVFKESNIEEFDSEAELIAQGFDLKTAIVYNEILNPPYIER